MISRYISVLLERTGRSQPARRCATMALALMLVVCFTTQATARTFIRDAEIEATIRGWATPLLRAAGLSPRDVRLHIVKSDELNAFVAGGLNVFIYTGLLRRTETPEEVIGVLAHEIGHIQGGHLVRLRGELESASAQTILFTVLGIAAAVASGDGRVGAAVGSFGQSAALRTLLKFSRTQESAADQAALRLLDATGQSASGLSSFLGVLADQELLLPEQQDPYLRTHPISHDRVEALQRHLQTSRYSAIPSSPESKMAHARMKAKLTGFLAPTGRVLREYPESDTTTPALIARAVAFHRSNRHRDAEAVIAVLTARHPDDPYIQELAGQILFERGDNSGALQAYARAMDLAPDEPLIATAFAHALINSNDQRAILEAIKILRNALSNEPKDGSGWRILGTAYGKSGQLGEAALALAESEALFGRPDLAFQQASRAQTLLKSGSPAWLRAEDIRLDAERKLVDRQKRR